MLLPKIGDLMIPPHLRVLHVSLEPLFVEGSLLHNLRFGVFNPKDPDADETRIKLVCRELKMPETIINKMHHDEDFRQTLSMTEKSLVRIARALISNPEVLCIHKPTIGFDHALASNIMKKIFKFVKEKGLHQDENASKLRRCRTCIFTASRKAPDLNFAHKVLHVKKKEGCGWLQSDPDQVREEDLF